jgi:hypothetical protein
MVVPLVLNWKLNHIHMKTGRIIFFLVILALISFSGLSQGLMNHGARGAGWLTGQLPDKNTRFSLEMGTGFSSFSSGGSMLGNYIAPRFEYDLTPSFTIIAGGSFSVNQYNNLPQPLVTNNNMNNVRPLQQGLSGHSLFVEGRYMVNENLFMTGSLYSDQGQIPLSMVNPEIFGYNTQGMTMGIEYRISKNLHFGAGVGVNRSNNPYQFYSPFADPFSNRHGRSRHQLFPY